MPEFTDEQLRQFHEDGWLIVKDAVPRELVREARRQVAHLDRCEQLYQSHGAHLEKMREARRKKEALLLEEQGCSFSPTLSKLAQKLNIPLGVDGYGRASRVSVVASHSSPSTLC